MKSRLKSFYTSGDININGDVIFVTDSNVLLSLYLFEDESFKSLSETMIRNKEKFWIPFYVALEFQRNRINQIKADNQVRCAIEEHFDKNHRNMEALISLIEKKKSKKYKDVIDGIKEILTDSKERKDEFLRRPSSLLLSPTKNDYFNDKVRMVIDDVFDGRVGEPYKQERLNEIYTTGADRYSKQIPPGFKDENKEDKTFHYNGIDYKNKYGDLIIWFQTLDFVSKLDDGVTVVFVTNDLKDDWWLKLNDVKIPHYYLKGEVFSINENINFELITADEFFRLLVDDKQSGDTSKTKENVYDDIQRVVELSSDINNFDIISVNVTDIDPSDDELSLVDDEDVSDVFGVCENCGFYEDECECEYYSDYKKYTRKVSPLERYKNEIISKSFKDSLDLYFKNEMENIKKHNQSNLIESYKYPIRIKEYPRRPTNKKKD